MKVQAVFYLAICGELSLWVVMSRHEWRSNNKERLACQLHSAEECKVLGQAMSECWMCVQLVAGDVVILGSDGLWDNLSDEQILDQVCTQHSPASHAMAAGPTWKRSQGMKWHTTLCDFWSLMSTCMHRSCTVVLGACVWRKAVSCEGRGWKTLIFSPAALLDAL